MGDMGEERYIGSRDGLRGWGRGQVWRADGSPAFKMPGIALLLHPCLNPVFRLFQGLLGVMLVRYGNPCRE
jgi:hypothetical protein